MNWRGTDGHVFVDDLGISVETWHCWGGWTAGRRRSGSWTSSCCFGSETGFDIGHVVHVVGEPLAPLVDVDAVMYTLGGECAFNWSSVMCVL